MGINSIGAYKLSAIVSRILKQKGAFISKPFLCYFFKNTSLLARLVCYGSMDE